MKKLSVLLLVTLIILMGCDMDNDNGNNINYFDNELEAYGSFNNTFVEIEYIGDVIRDVSIENTQTEINDLYENQMDILENMIERSQAFPDKNAISNLNLIIVDYDDILSAYNDALKNI